MYEFVELVHLSHAYTGASCDSQILWLVSNSLAYFETDTVGLRKSDIHYRF